MSKTLYDILQVSNSADIDVIDAAYSRLRERNASDDVMLKTLKQAYDTLSDPTRRAQYDQRFVSQVAPARVTGYRSDLADVDPSWMRGPRMLTIIIGVAIATGAALYISHAKTSKKVEAQKEIAKGVTLNDAKRVETERVLVERSTDNQARAVDYAGQALARNSDMQDQAEVRRSRQLDVNTRRSEEESRRRDEQIRLARERQEQQLALQRAAEQRSREDYDRRVAAETLARDKRALRELCRDNYGYRARC